MVVYGREARLPISLEFLALEKAHQLELIENDAMYVRMVDLMELEEKRHQAIHTLEIHQQQMNNNFNKKAKVRNLKEGDLVLKWNANREKVGRHSKFDTLWSGPYVIISCKKANAFQLSMPNGEILPILVNGIYLKPCF